MWILNISNSNQIVPVKLSESAAAHSQSKIKENVSFGFLWTNKNPLGNDNVSRIFPCSMNDTVFESGPLK